MPNRNLFLILNLVFIFMVDLSKAQVNNHQESATKATQSERLLPFGHEWAQKNGIDLPLPMGISSFFIYMSRDIEVTNVDVKVLNQPPQTINDFASFAVRNQTSVIAAKYDVWILPVLNVYVLGGFATTNANVNAAFSVEHPILPLPPSEFNINTSTVVNGPYFGFGSSVVGGYKNWFLLADANYGKSWPSELETPVNFLFVSLRTGFMGKISDKNTIKSWVGGAYMHSKTILEINVPSNTLDEVLVYISQEPVNPWTAHCGFMLGFGKRFEIMTELGSNFKDASISVMTATWRF